MEITKSGRDQHKNLKMAITLLEERINSKNKESMIYEIKEIKQSQIGTNSRGGKIRTYNFIQNFIENHITGKRCNNPDQVIKKGRFDLII